MTYNKFFILFFFTLIAHIPAMGNAGGGPTFYYKFAVKSSLTGAGMVYATNNDTTEVRFRDDEYSSFTFEEPSLATVKTASVTAFLFAQPKDGYMFTHWTRSEDNTIFSYSKKATDLVTTTSTNFQNPKVANYVAHFSKIGMVYPVSSDEHLGVVSINIPDNTIGDEVTLTAMPDMLSGKFKGWRRNSGETLITENPYTIKVSNSNKGTYTAIFEPKGIEDGIYVMLENMGTETYLAVKGNQETIDKDQRYFKNSMMLVDIHNPNVRSNPAFILKLKGVSNGTGGLSAVEIVGQGISTFDIGKRQFRIEKYKDGEYFIFANNGGFTGYLKDNDEAESGQMEELGDYHSPGIWNRWNFNDRYKWLIKLVDKAHLDENYLGASPSAGTLRNGKYYTTMYTAFPYECQDGVKAYIVDKISEDGSVHLHELAEGIVPEYTAVILECNSTSPEHNRLLPLTITPSPIEKTNLLKGEMWFSDGSGDEANYRTAFDPATMRVLSNDDGKFHNTNNKATADNDSIYPYIVNNTCYLDLSGMANPPEEMEIAKDGDDDPFMRGDVDGNGIVNVVDVMLTIGHILGLPTQVFIFKNADTDENGIVNVVDTMWIVNYILTN